MKTGLEIFKRAMDEIRSDPSIGVEVIECNVSLDADGTPVAEAEAAIHLRLVGYPRHAKNGSEAS